ncbi:MAG: DUF1847 domain-containing protein [Candidatus Geothermarchaeales archaeon]
MAKDFKAEIMCDQCRRFDCWKGYPEEVPDFCLSKGFKGALEEAREGYHTPGNAEVYLAASRIIKEGYGRWTRLEEVIEFARELGIRKIGMAICLALNREGRAVAELIRGAGFDVFSTLCKVGGLGQRECGVSEEYVFGTYPTACNPITQAKILNSFGTELNIIIGLCLGHDILFTKHSRAPVTTLIVKDRVTGNNPEAALSSFVHRRRLWKKYCGKEVY